MNILQNTKTLRLGNTSYPLVFDSIKYDDGYYRSVYIFDVSDLKLSKIYKCLSFLLMGKSNFYILDKNKKKVYMRFNLDMGNYVLLTNVHGIYKINDLNKIIDFKHTGFPGSGHFFYVNKKKLDFTDLNNFKKTEYQHFFLKVLKHVLKGMLPKNSWRKKRLNRISIFQNYLNNIN